MTINCIARSLRHTLLATSLACALGAQAQETPTPPGGIPVGPMIAYPGVDLTIGHNDNLFLTNTNKIGSTLTTISPYVKLEGKTGAHKFDFSLRADDGRFSNASADNYTDYAVSANGDFVISGRAGLKLRGEHRYGHDPRGTTQSPATPTPNEYVNNGIQGVFSYGAPGAQGRFEINGGLFTKRYENNQTVTAALNYDTDTLGGTFFWRIAPKTELLAQIQQSKLDYSLAGSTQDSTETRYLVGAKWEATAATQGIVKFGRQEKDFDNNAAGRANFSGSSWDAAVRWSPLTYSVFDFTTSKSTAESTGTGDFILTSQYGVAWNHAWNSRLSSVVVGSSKKDDFIGTGGGRQDTTNTVGLKLNYQMQRWLKLSGSYEWSERDSNSAVFEYKKNLLMFTLGATL